MSSLRSLAKKARVMLVSSESTGSDQALPAQLAGPYIKRILHHETIAINAQNVADSLLATADGQIPEFTTFEDVTPPFRWTWIEARIDGADGSSVRLGCLTQRNDAEGCPFTKQFQDDARKLGNLQSEGPYKHALLMLSFIENDGQIEGPLGMAGVLTDEYGEAQGWAMCPFFWRDHADESKRLSLELISHCSGLALEAFCWINTQGTQLVESEHPKQSHKHRDLVPMSVWRTIVVGPVSAPGTKVSEFSSESAERREHWVRAHRADYRKGAGLFGRIKALIWVPEHKRGNHDLGTVVPEYVVKR